MRDYLQNGILRYQKMVEDEYLVGSVDAAANLVFRALLEGKPVLVCGNGGSASDALHISGELVGRFNFTRPALNVICLNSNVTVMTAWANDVDYDSVFSRQVEAHGVPGGVFWGLSTSGSSTSVVEGFHAATRMGMSTIAFTGESGGRLAHGPDVLVNVPAVEAAHVQELHIPLYHYVCAEVERRIVAEQPPS